MREKSPKNRKLLTLGLVLAVIEQYWCQKTNENILLFVGVDEYQKLEQEELNLLLDDLCNNSKRNESSKLSFFCMLAGTDLNKSRIARTSHPNTTRTPIQFLTHMESMKAIGPYISKIHPGFVVSDAFSQNVFLLGGVPRLLTAFAKRVSEMDFSSLVENELRDIRNAVLWKLQNPDLSLSDILKLLALSFTNTEIGNEQERPFENSTLPSARDITWNQMVANGLCLLKDTGRVIVPFHLVAQALKRKPAKVNSLNVSEKALLDSLNDLVLDVEIPHSHVPAWLSWEAFGANFYCIRINSFLVLESRNDDRVKVPLQFLLRGTVFPNSKIFQKKVYLKKAKVFNSVQKYGPDLPRTISRKNNSYITVDWFQSETLQVVMNGDDGAAVDIFFILERADGLGSIIVLDQRKRWGSDVTESKLLDFQSKIPKAPLFLEEDKVLFVYGLMSVYSSVNIPIDSTEREKGALRDCTFYISVKESIEFHGTLFDHPGCSLAIDVNSALKTTVAQIFSGNASVRKRLAESVLQHRVKKRIANYGELSDLVREWNGELDESAKNRIKF
ncbi:hypothetical protein HDV01_003256 [Terramyces sp. JEL0728]|nr:hypothetical protein HDV01_003256 [Terramyces sp. JEL0728]